MSTSFLEKFKGKTQQVGKTGLVGLMQGGQGQNKAIVQTNIQYRPPNVSSQRQNEPRYGAPASKNNLSKQKPQKTTYGNNIKAAKQKAKPEPINPKPVEQVSPFLVMNPFCLDDQQPGQPFNPPPPKKTIVTPTYVQKQHSQSSYKGDQTKKSTIRGNSTDNKGWSKLGGLGANIGGDDWQQKRKKIEKMQEFAEQVKMSNQQKVKQRKPFEDRIEVKKQKTIREKALQYSKNIPKPPPVKKIRKEEEPEDIPYVQQKNNELQEYQRRHQQLQRMLKN